ncbi:MAG TPA: bacteriocin-protection protein, partial [Sulfitobacter sp.]|nr:bacteriocin-protection protein [Sulfitobacter sp.]
MEDPIFFTNQDAFEAWFKDHQDATEVWVGYHRRSTGRDSITWSESVDVALCIGWIDGIRKSIDSQSYK